MNHRINELAQTAGLRVDPDGEIGSSFTGSIDSGYRKFAELIVEECRNVLADEYRKSPIETIGYFISVDEAIAKHFYGKE